jgi:hypothetical protein
MPIGRLSSSAFVITDRMCTISSSVNESRSLVSFSLHSVSSSEFFVQASIELRFDAVTDVVVVVAAVCGVIVTVFTVLLFVIVIDADDDDGGCGGGGGSDDKFELELSIDCRDCGLLGGTEWLSLMLLKLWQPTIVCLRSDARRDSHCVAKS